MPFGRLAVDGASLHAPSCQKAFPNAKTFICPGVERKRKDLRYDKVLDDDGAPLSNDVEHVFG